MAWTEYEWNKQLCYFHVKNIYNLTQSWTLSFLWVSCETTLFTHTYKNKMQQYVHMKMSLWINITLQKTLHSLFNLWQHVSLQASPDVIFTKHLYPAVHVPDDLHSQPSQQQPKKKVIFTAAWTLKKAALLCRLTMLMVENSVLSLCTQYTAAWRLNMFNIFALSETQKWTIPQPTLVAYMSVPFNSAEIHTSLMS